MTYVAAGSAGGLDAERRSQIVKSARKLCEQAAQADARQIPERSQLNTLLRAGLGTPSPQEVVLFVRYQAARKGGKQGAFLSSVADAIEQADWSGDIEAVRFFLGSLARAGLVAKDHKSQQARGSGHRG